MNAYPQWHGSYSESQPEESQPELDLIYSQSVSEEFDEQHFLLITSLQDISNKIRSQYTEIVLDYKF